MKKIILTSPKFPGEIILLYNTALVLVSIDFSGVDMNEEQTAWMLRKIPSRLYAEFIQAFQPVPVEAVIEGYEVQFEEFWNKYALKINADRCKTLWKKLTASEKQKAYSGIDAYN